MSEEFKKGDKVKWNTAQGETTGEVEKKLTSPIDIKKHHVAASKDNPQYLVKSDKTGKEAAHKPDALENIEE
jgi:Hypervirulence associated proteins TUDOR domain